MPRVGKQAFAEGENVRNRGFLRSGVSAIAEGNRRVPRRAYSLTVKRRIRIAQMAVRFCLGPL